MISGGAADHIANEIMKSEGLKSEAAHKARLALMLGKAKFKDFKGVQQIYEDIKVFFQQGNKPWTLQFLNCCKKF